MTRAINGHSSRYHCPALAKGLCSALLMLFGVSLIPLSALAACDHFQQNRQPLFGDLHIHTGLSFDAYISSIQLGPEDAYRYAKGEPIQLPGADGQPGDHVRIDRPLDFAAVCSAEGVRR